jgi:hypothetical protein
MSEQKEAKRTFKFDNDTKRYHRFQVEIDGDIKGSVFIPKGAAILTKPHIVGGVFTPIRTGARDGEAPEFMDTIKRARKRRSFWTL